MSFYPSYEMIYSNNKLFIRDFFKKIGYFYVLETTLNIILADDISNIRNRDIRISRNISFFDQSILLRGKKIVWVLFDIRKLYVPYCGLVISLLNQLIKNIFIDYVINRGI